MGLMPKTKKKINATGSLQNENMICFFINIQTKYSYNFYFTKFRYFRGGSTADCAGHHAGMLEGVQKQKGSGP
jgi:hypothetical protein